MQFAKYKISRYLLRKLSQSLILTKESIQEKNKYIMSR